MKILLSDGTYKNTLAITQNMGRLGNQVGVLGDSNQTVLSWLSKHCLFNEHINSSASDEEYLSSLVNILQNRSYDRYIPVGYNSCRIASKYKKIVSKYTELTISDYNAFCRAENKYLSTRLCDQLHIPHPHTYLIKTEKDLLDLKNIEYPVVLKGAKEVGKNIVTYVNSVHELIESYNTLLELHSLPRGYEILLQEYIDGGGYGYFGNYINGHVIDFYMHKRIREYPVSGGASTCAEIYHDEKLMKYGHDILSHLKWTGVAMVEFRKDYVNGEYYFLEINPKFWGSIGLGLRAGHNFPMQITYPDVKISECTVGKRLRFHWPFSGDFKNFQDSKNKDVIVDFLNPRVKNNLSVTDPLPSLKEIGSYVKNLY